MFLCIKCGYKSIKWIGKCPACGEWETFVEEIEEKRKDLPFVKEKTSPKLLKEIEGKNKDRIKTGIEELDKVLGGGLVKGEIILVGGEPGIGKSTLLLEVASKLSPKAKTLYVSAEESPQQVALRAKRLDSDFTNLYILGEDNLEVVAQYVEEYGFEFLVIDSIQVVYSPYVEGLKGSVSQIRGSAEFLTQIAKLKNTVVFLVGHVTKEGIIAGPKILEHLVDCVLYFEGELISNYRILRATKNRFGPTQEFAVFEMTSCGLKEVKKTGKLFLPHKNESISGSCIVCVIEGLRPLLVEIQSLVGRASFGMVKRRCLGFDFNRFSLLVAIIEKKLRLLLSGEDVFLNVAGGLKINDPAADLGAIMAIISSFKEKEIIQNQVFIGEVGLTGEVRRVNNINLRLKEVERGHFKRCFIPKGNLQEVEKSFHLDIESVSSLKDALDKIWR
jgi:DNA repair protein RadA/Sms